MADNRNEMLDEGIEALTKGDAQSAQERAATEALAEEAERSALHDAILSKYEDLGRSLLSDTMPERLDPRIAKRLEPILGDLSNVRVHSGPMATAAARSLNARAFAIGDGDIFIDEREYSPGSREGASLLAHEVAHTKDAASGFALSSRGGGADAEHERFAESIERVFAEEDLDQVAAMVHTEIGDAAKSQSASAGEPEEPKVDLHALEDEVWRLLSKQTSLTRDRRGY